MPDAQKILAEATKLRDERFGKFRAKLKGRASERFNETTVDVPKAYQKTTQQHRSNIIEDEGRQVATLVYAMPVPHITPPSPEDQPATTKVEQFLTAMHQELEDVHGPVWWQCTMAQVHDNIGWVYFAPKKKPYGKQPKAPDSEDPDELMEFERKNTRYKMDAGIRAVFDYEFATTATVLYQGSVFDPEKLYVWKEVPASSFREQYEANEPGYDMGTSTGETMVQVIEYWDREWCVILAETSEKKYLGMKTVNGARILQDWKHGFGRVPYFARPAFATEQLSEDKKFSGPLDGIHNEMPNHKRLRTMGDSVAYQTAFAPLKIITREQGEQIVDDSGKPLVFLELEPGKARQLAPGQDVMPIPQSPEVQNLFLEIAASEQRIQRYSLPPVVKGISPGADTANSAISNLRTFNLSNLKPMSEQTARQARAMYRFALEWMQKQDETFYVLDAQSDRYISLSSDEIVSVNVQCKAPPDMGQFQLALEKHALEMYMAGGIPEVEFHEMRGKENPEEFVLANAAERLRKMLEPVVMNQIVTDLGMMQAVQQMIQANAQTGSARNAVPGMMQQVEQMNSGMGSGSPMQPRPPGVRSSATDVNTHPEMMMHGV